MRAFTDAQRTMPDPPPRPRQLSFGVVDKPDAPDVWGRQETAAAREMVMREHRRGRPPGNKSTSEWTRI